MAAGEMIELDTSAVAGQSSGPIDTSDNLNMFELNSKIFITNGSKLRVADFINTKLTVTAMTSPPAHGDLLTQDQTDDKYAYMIVDFVNTAKTKIYGYAYYAGGATAFVTTIDISSNNATATMQANGETAGDPIPNAQITAVTAKPHWYDWTVYPDVVLTIDGSTKTYGSLPNKAYLGCNYRGRPVLSGDPEHPHQWYMGRQLFPWDFAYMANDAQSPVTGGNADAGEIGDIVRALIPYKDDHLVFGCATSMWYLAGDPAEGGGLFELDLTVGIYGSNSWCFDGDGNLHFWGTNGVYKTSIPGNPKCVSEIRLPKLVQDESVNPATYRITMAYDRTRVGIGIFITKLSDGSNSDYWYDLQTEGFFPESYGDNRGAYSSFFYGANNPDYRDLLVGCKDGYIRKFNESLKSDNDSADAVGVGTVIIDSYVGYGPLQVHRDPKSEGTVTQIDLVTAGGESGGSESDSNNIACKVFVSGSAEGVLERLVAGTTPQAARTFQAPGRRRGNTVKVRAKGVYAAIELRNSTLAESWGFEQMMVNAKSAGRRK